MSMVRGMSNIYVIGKGELQLIDDVEQIGDGYESTGCDDALSLDLVEPRGEKTVEHRHHKRFHLKEDAFALIRSISAKPLNIQGKSMGCIACAVFNARPVRLGKIDNISMGGLMFRHVGGKTNLYRTFVLEILLADCGFYLPNIAFDIKADVALSGEIPDSAFEIRQVHIQFQNLSAYQQARLNDFLLINGTEENIDDRNKGSLKGRKSDGQRRGYERVHRPKRF